MPKLEKSRAFLVLLALSPSSSREARESSDERRDASKLICEGEKEKEKRMTKEKNVCFFRDGKILFISLRGLRNKKWFRAFPIRLAPSEARDRQRWATIDV